MDKILSSAIFAGSFASISTKLIAEYFQRPKTAFDTNLADRTLLQQEREFIAREAKIMRDELKAERDEARTQAEHLEAKFLEQEKTHLARMNTLFEAISYWKKHALEGKSFDDFQDSPTLDDLFLKIP